MIKIEQALEMAKRLRSLMGSWPLSQEAADTIDALIAALSDERMRCAQADNSVAQMAAELATLKAQKPVAWALPEITQQHNGQIVKHTAFHGYSVKLYLAAGAQSIPSGYQFVPVEPTTEMIDATGATESDMREMVVADYKAMLAAAQE